MSIFSLLDQFSDAERKLTATRFLAPCLPESRISTQVKGITYTFRPSNAEFEGWALWKAIDPKNAEMVEDADYFAVEEYLKLLKPLRLRLTYRMQGRSWMAFPANESDAMQQLGVAKPVPVHLVDNAAQFEQVMARWDGAAFWFQEVDHREDPEIAEKLSASFAAETEISDLKFSGMTPEMRSAYSLVWYQKIQEEEAEEFENMLQDEAERDATQRRLVRAARNHARKERQYAQKGENRLRQALETAGGGLSSARDSGANWLVNWVTSTGEHHTSVIAKRDLTVVSAGICLDGYDDWFDIQSLVAVVEQRPGWASL